MTDKWSWSEVFEPGFSKKRLIGQLTIFLLWLAVTGIALFLLRPSAMKHGTHTQLGLPPCPSVILFDRPCPGCGLTTSWTATVHGDLNRAFEANAFGTLFYLGFTVSAWLGLFGFFKGYRLRTEGRRLNVVLTYVLVAFLGYGIIRFALTPLGSPFYSGLWKNLASHSSSEK